MILFATGKAATTGLDTTGLGTKGLAIIGFATEINFGAFFNSGCTVKEAFLGASFLATGIFVVDLGATFTGAEGTLAGKIEMEFFFILFLER